MQGGLFFIQVPGNLKLWGGGNCSKVKRMLEKEIRLKGHRVRGGVKAPCLPFKAERNWEKSVLRVKKVSLNVLSRALFHSNEIERPLISSLMTIPIHILCGSLELILSIQQTCMI